MYVVLGSIGRQFLFHLHGGPQTGFRGRCQKNDQGRHVHIGRGSRQRAWSKCGFCNNFKVAMWGRAEATSSLKNTWRRFTLCTTPCGVSRVAASIVAAPPSRTSTQTHMSGSSHRLLPHCLTGTKSPIVTKAQPQTRVRSWLAWQQFSDASRSEAYWPPGGWPVPQGQYLDNFSWFKVVQRSRE